MTGILYLCATPIGNLEDMSYRAVRVLKEADLIAAEDTRNSIILLNHFDINTPMTSYHRNNRYDKAEYLLEQLKKGKNIALISDAGMPGISDPGEELVDICINNGIKVSPIPGATAGLSALICSGLSSGRFCFEGFLPTDKKQKNKLLKQLSKETRTIILYEAPHRLVKTLAELNAVLGNRKTAICRELTKKHEEFIYTDLEGAGIYYAENEPRGEYVLIIKGIDEEILENAAREEFMKWSVEEHIASYMDKGMDKKEAMKQAAKDRGVTKRDIYSELNQNKGRKEDEI